MSTFHFEVKEIGQKLTDDELDELKRNRYGDVRGRQTNLAESPAQLLLEAAAAKQNTSKKVVDLQKQQVALKPSSDLGIMSKVSDSHLDNAKKNGVSSDGLNKLSASGRVTCPVKQKEYRRPDGRKRIIPEPVGVPPQQENITSLSHSQALNLPLVSSDVNKDDNVAKARRTSDVKERSVLTAKACFSDSLVIERVPAASGRDVGVLVESIGSAKASSSLASCNATLAICVVDRKEGSDAMPIKLEASPREHTISDIVGVSNMSSVKETEIICSRGSQTLWSDRISGKVSVLAGNANFWAVGFEDGCLQVSKLSIFIFS